MKAPDKYYLKWDVEKASFMLDKSFHVDGFIYSIRKILITPEQAEQFAERITKKYLQKGKYIDMNVLEYEFDWFFHICKECGTATTHVDWVKRQEVWCYDCYHDRLEDKYRAGWRKHWERKRVERMKLYAKTEQGIADTVGLKAIKANVIIQMKKAGKTQADLAVVLGNTEENINKLLNANKSIKMEYLYKIAEWLFVPMDLLLKQPRGQAPLKRRNGIPVVMYRKIMKTIK